MASTTTPQGYAWLASAAERGEIHTVRLGWSDRLGGWRGKRVPVREFLERAPLAMGFCDGMIVCDVQCDIIETVPFSNYSTGYPDMHVHFDPVHARPVAWVPGEAYVLSFPRDATGLPLQVAPTVVLARVLNRLGGLPLRVVASAALAGAAIHDPAVMTSPGSGLLDAGSPAGAGNALLAGLAGSGLPAVSARSGFDAGTFVLEFGETDPAELAAALVIAKGAAREIAAARGAIAVFMTLRPFATEPSLLRLEIGVSGADPIDATVVDERLSALRPLMFPSINAMKARPPSTIVYKKSSTDQRVVSYASSEADSATALAAVLAAIGSLNAAAVDPNDNACAPGSPGRSIRSLRDASLMREHPWVSAWLGEPFIENAIPLFEHEADLFDNAVTDWETARYWSLS